MKLGRSMSFENENELVRHVQAMLKLGMTVSQIEQNLLSKGLQSAKATQVVERALESNVHEQLAPAVAAERRSFANRIASAVVGLVYISICYSRHGAQAAIQICLAIALPIACIWFPAAFGSFTGFIGVGRAIAFTTPALMVRIGGWLLLIVIGAFKIFR